MYTAFSPTLRSARPKGDMCLAKNDMYWLWVNFVGRKVMGREKTKIAER